ncbi:hypothetical protein TNCV_3533881, partial [Trichonephila clavipes]
HGPGRVVSKKHSRKSKCIPSRTQRSSRDGITHTREQTWTTGFSKGRKERTAALHDYRETSEERGKLKLDGTRATARQRLFPEGWEEMKNRMKENVLIERTPRQNGEGGRTPKHETLYRCRAPAGRGRTQEGSRDG